MLFRVEYILRDLGLSEGDSFEFTEVSSLPTTLTIHRPTKEESPSLSPDQCLGILNTEDPVTDKVRPKFEIKEPPHPAVDEIDGRVTVRLRDFLLRASGVLRWRRGLTGPPNPIATIKRPLEWSDDGQNWQMVPGAFRLKAEMDIPHQRMSEGIRSSIIDLVHADAREPLGHELFQEAWKQRMELPRSSLMIGLAAAEVGFKMFVADLVPHAEWLAMHAPSPPLERMLAEYLPLLPVRQHIKDCPIFVPKEIFDTLKKGVNLRNKTAHAGEKVKADTLTEILLAVRDLLYLLDLYAGQAWALEAISHGTQLLIKAEVEAHQPLPTSSPPESLSP